MALGLLRYNEVHGEGGLKEALDNRSPGDDPLGDRKLPNPVVTL